MLLDICSNRYSVSFQQLIQTKVYIEYLGKINMLIYFISVYLNLSFSQPLIFPVPFKFLQNSSGGHYYHNQYN